ncbi:FMN-binding protein [Paenibacillus alginolyticus]|uniref:FMN-binding protein n=1 Tax=Paenibacillus alginolyticus TaxID=59839 RepID=A0ABT4GPR8_9BACL|nr:FMN-binding protein [Paenibacillus alginolyticus]MCY9698187.1 FMN-binding protein [Paenibacillus alginolyticus]MEC0148522.1 FMN-binding protein [Paenibacillus alginolyticus]
MAKMNKKWVALCSTAIGAIYAAGYFATETQATIQQPQQQVQVTQTKSTQTNRLYKEGTYTGSGSNRRGSIQVAVTIKSDKITDVEISHFAMHYTIDDVVGLPQEVLQKQSAQVRNVSGATYSTQAFKDAVQDALSQARNA